MFPYSLPELTVGELTVLETHLTYMAVRQLGGGFRDSWPGYVLEDFHSRHWAEHEWDALRSSLIEKGILAQHSHSSGALNLTERGVRFALFNGMLHEMPAYIFGERDAPDAEVDLEQEPEEEDDDFADRCLEAEMDILDAEEEVAYGWADLHWPIPDHMMPLIADTIATLRSDPPNI